MKLCIDTSNTTKTIVELDGKYLKAENKRQKSQQLLSLIDKITQNGSLIDKIDEIEVNLGPGSYTGLKVGASVANALGFALDIPVNGRRQLVVPKYKNLSPVATEPCFRRLK